MAFRGTHTCRPSSYIHITAETSWCTRVPDKRIINCHYFLLNIFKDLFYVCVYIFMYIYTHTLYACMVPRQPKEGIGYPRTEVTGGYELLCGCQN